MTDTYTLDPHTGLVDIIRDIRGLFTESCYRELGIKTLPVLRLDKHKIRLQEWFTSTELQAMAHLI